MGGGSNPAHKTQSFLDFRSALNSPLGMGSLNKSVPTFSHKKTEKMKNNNKIGTPKESTNGRVYFPIASTSFDDN